MKLVDPYVKLIENNNPFVIIEKAARICYASESKDSDPGEFCEKLWNKTHRSPFRHGSLYFKATIGTKDLAFVHHNPYIKYVILGPDIYFSTNYQYYKEHPWNFTQLRDNQISMDEVIIKAEIYPQVYDILRVTFEVRTQISTTREFNRMSPNNICERSTRYCNFSKDKFNNEITICKPYWYSVLKQDKRIYCEARWKEAEEAYFETLNYLSPQDAREFLPLATATIAVYTYSIREWKHFLDLRYKGITGPSHPNIQLLAKEIYNQLKENDYLNNYEV